MKYLITESQYNNLVDKYKNLSKIDRYITSKFEPHEEIRKKQTSGFPDEITWVNDGKIIVKMGLSEMLWVDWTIWRAIEKMFSLEKKEVREVIKQWMEKHYDLTEITPNGYFLNK
jgi:hypothetical protein